MPDPDLGEQLGVADGEVHALEGRGVGGRDVEHHVLQVLGVASQPVLQTLNKDPSVLQGRAAVSYISSTLSAIMTSLSTVTPRIDLQ